MKNQETPKITDDRCPLRQPNVTLLQVVRERIRLRHLSYYTEKQYIGWIKRFVKFHEIRQARDILPEHVHLFLSHLAVKRNVAPSTQNQALNALVFLFRHVLDKDLGQLKNITWAQRSQHMPVVLTRSEVSQLLDQLRSTPLKWLIASLLYGTGMRLIECLRLRVKDIDLQKYLITIRDAKGEKDRVVPMPKKLIPHIISQIERAKTIFERDRKDGFGEVSLPYALVHKYPNASSQWIWQYVFPSYHRSIDPRSGKEKRHHIFDSFMQDAVAGAVQRAGIQKKVNCHTFRHSFATHLLEYGEDIRTIQTLLGHNHLKTTMIYTHLTEHHFMRLTSPFDSLGLEQAATIGLNARPQLYNPQSQQVYDSHHAKHEPTKHLENTLESKGTSGNTVISLTKHSEIDLFKDNAIEARPNQVKVKLSTCFCLNFWKYRIKNLLIGFSLSDR